MEKNIYSSLYTNINLQSKLIILVGQIYLNPLYTFAGWRRIKRMEFIGRIHMYVYLFKAIVRFYLLFQFEMLFRYDKKICLKFYSLLTMSKFTIFFFVLEGY